MTTYEEAIGLILKNTRKLGCEKVRIAEAVGRVLTQDICSDISMPPFNKSAMDGYALNYKDVKKAPVKLKCIGIIGAGKDFKKRVKRGECVKIMTGAPIPYGADSVVMVENTQSLGKYVEIKKTIRKGENVCLKAEDIRKGQKIFSKNRSISISDIGTLAALGKEFVEVVKKPKVAFINTGGEIVPLGRKLQKNKIYNSNGPQIQSLLKNDGITAFSLGIAKDRSKDLEIALKKGLKFDMFLVSGGVSMGDWDLVPSVLEKLGVKKIFHKVKVKPGKPLFFGTKGRRLVFGIPGNPVSGFLTYLVFIRPALCKIMGYSEKEYEFKKGILDNAFYNKAKRKYFVPVEIFKKKQIHYLRHVSSHGSADILSLSRADGFMVVDENLRLIRKGTAMQFITWKKI